MAKTYTLAQVKKNIKDQGYSYCCLVNDSGKVIVPYNKASDTKGALGKFAEIEKRFNVLEDGVYYIECKNSFNKKITPDSYPVCKGAATLDEARVPASPSVQPVLTDNGKVMSYQDALKLTSENASLKAELTAVRKELSELEKDYSELEADFEEDDKGVLAETVPPVQNWLQTTMPTLIPLADKLFETWNRKLDLEEKRMSNGGGRKPAPAQTGNGKQVAQPGTPEFEIYLDQLEALDDTAFRTECEYLAKFHPGVYVHVYEAFKEEEEEPANEN